MVIIRQRQCRSKLKKRKNNKPEQEIQKAILDYLRLLGIPAWRMNSGALKTEASFVRFGVPGMSDIIGILPDGKFLAIEVKAAKGKLTILQQDFLDTIRSHGGIAIVARSLDDLGMIIDKYKSWYRKDAIRLSRLISGSAERSN